jgi:hypothetical protein
MAAPARSTVHLSGPLAARVAVESARRGVPVAAIVDEAVSAYLEDESTDESIIAIGAILLPDEGPRPVSERASQAIREILDTSSDPPPALRKLLRGL